MTFGCRNARSSHERGSPEINPRVLLLCILKSSNIEKQLSCIAIVLFWANFAQDKTISMQDSRFSIFEVIHIHNNKTHGFISGDRDLALAELAVALKAAAEAKAQIAELHLHKAVVMSVRVRHVRVANWVRHHFGMRMPVVRQSYQKRMRCACLTG